MHVRKVTFAHAKLKIIKYMLRISCYSLSNQKNIFSEYLQWSVTVLVIYDPGQSIPELKLQLFVVRPPLFELPLHAVHVLLQEVHQFTQRIRGPEIEKEECHKFNGTIV